MTKEARRPKAEVNAKLFGLRISDFGFLSDFGIRPSDFFNLSHSFHLRQSLFDPPDLEDLKGFRLLAHWAGIQRFVLARRDNHHHAQGHAQGPELSDELAALFVPRQEYAYTAA